MDINVIKGDKTTVELSGRLDTAAVEEFDKELATVVAENNNIVFDCSELEYISSSGLRAILTIHKQLQAKGGELALCNLQPTVKSVFDLTGFTMMMKIL